jgi:hypothetical protein
MTPKEFEEKMKELKNEHDPETAHFLMDELIVSLLVELGYEDGVEIFIRQTKWYS